MTDFYASLFGLGVLLAAYLIGSLPFAVIVSRLMGLADPRSYGSGNPGATNVLRTGNKWAAGLTLLGDGFKGWAAVVAAQWALPYFQLSSLLLGATVLAVFLGHLFPLFLKFKGGKGVATALGILLGLQPWLGVAAVASWLIVARATRYSSLAALAAAVFTPFYYFFGSGVVWRFDGGSFAALVVMAFLLCLRHRANIARLMQGKESRIGSDAVSAPLRGKRRVKAKRR